MPKNTSLLAIGWDVSKSHCQIKIKTDLNRCNCSSWDNILQMESWCSGMTYTRKTLRYLHSILALYTLTVNSLDVKSQVPVRQCDVLWAVQIAGSSPSIANP